MAKFEVTLRVTKRVTFDRIYARDEQEAEEKATDIATGWKDVVEVEAEDVERTV